MTFSCFCFFSACFVIAARRRRKKEKEEKITQIQDERTIPEDPMQDNTEEIAWEVAQIPALPQRPRPVPDAAWM